MGFFSTKPSKCYQGVARMTMGKIPKGYRIQVPSSNNPRPTDKEIRKTLEGLGFKLSGLFNSTSDATHSGNWEWSE